MEKNLQNEEALQKLKKLANEINICMFITDPDNKQSSRPMATIKVEDEGTLWFYTHLSSGKTSEIEQEQEVHLVYAHPGKDSYMDLRGRGTVVTDRSKIKELWNPIVKAWFPQGVDDPDLCLLKVIPQSAHYWDSETGKMVEFLKIIAAAVTGKRLAEGAEGNLDV
jgi:general stress protein 26